MNAQLLLQALDPNELIYEAAPLVAWDIGAVSNEEEVAEFMYHGGPFPPQASAKAPLIKDTRPDQKYWHFVKKEMHTFLCTNDKRYQELWEKINSLGEKSTTAIIGVIATFLGAIIGAPATIIAGFIAVCLYAAVKLGKEAYCSYVAQSGA